MKLVSAQLSYFFSDPQVRRNVRALLKYFVLVIVVVAVFSVLFHLIMLHVEGEYHSWITGAYWTLTVMSTLGFGDITFSSDIGRAFSIVVLVTGVILLLIVLPFAFIRFFYAPWLEAQVALRTPRKLREGTEGHLVFVAYEEVARACVERLQGQGIPYCVIEPDPAIASALLAEGVRVIAGDRDSRATYEAVLVEHARMVVANASDALNTSATLTVREVAPHVPVVAFASVEDAVDILELSGATHVLALKLQLGEQLASRVNTGRAEPHVIGQYRDLVFAELMIQNTPLAGQTVREAQLRERTGMSLAGVWERGRLVPARPDLCLSPLSVPVVIGTAAQVEAMGTLLTPHDPDYEPVLLIGGGKVGRAAARFLMRQGAPVHLIEQNPVIVERAAAFGIPVFAGDATDRDLLVEAGIEQAPSVLLTTHDDATNIYLTAYCRRLNPNARIVCRVTNERNVEAVHRAGADFVLSYSSLGAGAVLSLLHGEKLLLIGEGLGLYHVPVPASLQGKTLAESGIGARTGINIVAIDHAGTFLTNPTPTTVLPEKGELLFVGTPAQREGFREVYGQA